MPCKRIHLRRRVKVPATADRLNSQDWLPHQLAENGEPWWIDNAAIGRYAHYTDEIEPSLLCFLAFEKITAFRRNNSPNLAQYIMGWSVAFHPPHRER